MPRKRLREGWPVRVYKFHAAPVGELPDGLWRQARAMQALWNRFVELRERAIEVSAPLNERVRAAREGGDKAAERAAREERAERWKEFEASLLDLLRSPEVKAGLGWEAREWIYDRFRTASSTALKSGGRLGFKRRLDSLVIPHRYTGGGVPVTRLFVSRRGKVRLDPLDPDVYAGQEWQRRRARHTRGTFVLASAEGGPEAAEFAFTATLHREVPADAVLKTASWCGRRHPVRGWQWSLQLSVEIPPSKLPGAPGETLEGDLEDDVESPASRRSRAMKDARPVAGLDLGWRKMDGYLRIGVLHGSDGRSIELRLPLEETAGKDVRRTNRLIARHAAERGARPDLLPTTLADIWELQSKTDLMLEETKAGIKELLTAEMLPEDARGVITHLAKVRNGGLVRLLRALDGMADGGGGLSAEAGQARELLTSWLAETDRARKRIADTRDRLLRRRRWYYENIALWAAQNYRRLAWEDDLGLKEMAEETSKLSGAGPDVALKLAAKYRGWAGLYELRQMIRRRAQEEHPGFLVKAGKNRTTIECEVCGEECEPTAQLVVRCPKGHRTDQDVRAAKNLLAQVEAEDVVPAAAAVRIPEALRHVVVVM